MSNAQNIINEIDTFLDKSMLRKSKITKQELINFIEQKWQEADKEKYNIHQGSIFIGRMINEYININDFENMMRWIVEMDAHSLSKKHPAYINNYYNGECCLECGNEEKALEFFKLCYAENKDYIFTRAPFCYQFFNKHLENQKELTNKKDSDEEGFDIIFELKYWQDFFKENEKLYYNLLDEDGEIVGKPTTEQQNGLEYLQKNQEIILRNLLNELLKKYPDLQNIYNYSEENKQDFMPDLKGIQDFADLLTPINFYVTSVIKEGYPYIGFGFSCSWDSEHGLGVMTHKDRIIEIAGADIAFDTWTAEKDLK
ncbi:MULTISPECIES: DUF6985 domain-containing protein [Pedobacter]|uniref:DUF6985 domain-containing protein n=1 Tax=Pedobacter TaxID=84567 RepID=UPI0029317DD3|nr:hypothetical protein [Pedobacter aquatilis]